MRKYSKGIGRRDLFVPEDGHEQIQESPQVERQFEMDSHEYVVGYEKEEGQIEPRLYVLFVEGENKEPAYFGQLQGRFSYSNLKISYVSLSNSTGYSGNLAQKMSLAVSDAYDNGFVVVDDELLIITDIDELYVVMDVDCLHDEISVEKKNECRATWIISNPCFEMWLYYSFHNKPEEDLHLMDVDVSQRSSVLKTLLNKVHKGGIGCRQAFDKMDEAIRNSRLFYSEDEQGLPVLYATSMFVLVQKIFMAIHDEYEQRLKIKKEKILNFRNLSKG